MIGFDYTDRIDPAALKAAGCSAVFRYLSNPGWPKNLTQPEANELLAAGIPIVLNYETSASFMLGGYSAGVACAKSARAQATALGAPANTRIWYSADFDATAAQLATILDFGRGAALVDGHDEVGVYGGLRVAQAEDAVGVPTWQTVAWSGGTWDPRAVARQTGQQQYVGGVQVDVNDIIDLAGLGAWGGPTTGGSVILGQDDIQAIAAAVYKFGSEDVTLKTGVMHNVPLGNLAHGAWVSTNDPNGPVLSALAQIKAQTAQQPMTAADLAAAVGPLLAPILAPLLPKLTADETAAIATACSTMTTAALEQHNLGGMDPATLAAELATHFKVV